MQAKAAGTFKLERFMLFSLTSDRNANSGDPRTALFGNTSSQRSSADMSNLVHSFNIQESVMHASIRGTAVIYDAVGFYYSFPIVGQEILEIEYTDLKGVTQSDKFFVYAVTDIKPGKSATDDYLEYKLHFVSFGKFWSDRYDIKRCIAEGSGTNRRYLPIFEQVQIIFDDYYKSSLRGTIKPLEVSQTDGEQKIVIPNMKPESAIHMLSRKAYSSNYKGQFFRFFENRQGYFFANMEEVFENSPKDQTYFYNSGPTDNTPEAELAKMENIVSLDLGESVNTIDALEQGAYYRKFIELDPLTRTRSEYSYKYKDEYRSNQFPDGIGTNLNLVHSDEFVDEHLNKWKEIYGIKDYPDPDIGNAYGLRPFAYYGDIFNSKTTMMYHLAQSHITVRIYGSNQVVAGSVIRIQNLPKFGVDIGDRRDSEREGYWLVVAANNEFYENTYMQTLTLAKGGLRV